jgi:multidrug efflux pump subunit AcrA (membrane-fusion protein)
MKKKLYLILVLLIILGASLTACDIFDVPREPTPVPTAVSDPNVVAEANLVPANHVMLSFVIPGRVSDILVQEGDLVSTGEVLAQLGDIESLDAQVASAEFTVLQAEQNLENLNDRADLLGAQAAVEKVKAQQELVAAERAWDAVDTDEFREELDDARVNMQEAEDDLEEAQEELEDYQDLEEDNPTREAAQDDLEEAQQAYDEAVWVFEDLQNQFDLTKFQLEAARAALEDAKRQAEETQDGPNPDDLALANAKLTQAQAQLDAAKNAQADADLTAPFAGKVIRIELTENAETAPGEMAMILADQSEWFLETNDLTENEVVRIDPTEQVIITFDALPKKSFTGEVESISEYFVEQFGDITYIVRIKLLDWDDQLRWGMTAEVTFENK